MSKILVTLLVLACAPVSVASAQSLGDVAKRERERREKNKKDGVAVREVSEEEIFGDDEGESSDEAGTEDEGEASEEPSSSEKQFDIELLPSNGGADLDQEQSERRRQEAEWRKRVADAKSRIEVARARRQQLEGLYLGEGQQYVDTNGRVVIRSRAHLQKLVDEATAELEAAEAALVALREEARRAGVPPGWLR